MAYNTQGDQPLQPIKPSDGSANNNAELDCMIVPDIQQLSLEIKRSSIPNAGLGLFATEKLISGRVIGVCTGPLFFDDAGTHRSSFSLPIIFPVKLPNGLIRKICMNVTGYMAYINDCINPSTWPNLTKWPDKDYNARFVFSNYTILVVATRDINKGEEILVEYGSGYWATRLHICQTC